jgi:hypothetical protein
VGDDRTSLLLLLRRCCVGRAGGRAGWASATTPRRSRRRTPDPSDLGIDAVPLRLQPRRLRTKAVTLPAGCWPIAGPPDRGLTQDGRRTSRGRASTCSWRLRLGLRGPRSHPGIGRTSGVLAWSCQGSMVCSRASSARRGAEAEACEWISVCSMQVQQPGHTLPIACDRRCLRSAWPQVSDAPPC